MFVISADQRSSRTTHDLVSVWRDLINSDYGQHLTLPADRNAGDEVQVLCTNAGVVVEIALRLTRSQQWSVGIGVGDVKKPLPAEVREALGPAFNAAREAVTDAKKRPTRFAVRSEGAPPDSAPSDQHIQSLMDLLLEIRRKRSPQGWELHDALMNVSTQAEAAKRLGITPAAASDRALAGSLKIEREALPALIGLLQALDELTEPTDPPERT